MQRRGIHCKIDSNTTDQIDKAAKWLVSGTKTGLLLYGKKGTGKSTLARAIMNVINIGCKGKERMVFCNNKDVNYGDNLLGSISFHYSTPTSYVDYLKSRNKLLIDDLGTYPADIREYGNYLSPMYDLLTYRYDENLFTLITSNYDLDSIKDKYDERIQDRMIEQYSRIGFDYESYRR